MERIDLRVPTAEDEAAALAYLKEHRDQGEEELNGTGGLTYLPDYAAFLQKIQDDLDYDHIRPGRVPASTFFGVRESDQKIVGMINIRHRLNDALLARGGHIGYGVRPSERQKGYASQMLMRALDFCRSLGLGRVLVCCNKDNKASAGVITHCGGVLEDERIDTDGSVFLRFWITL